jgi:hypothetical protein
MIPIIAKAAAVAATAVLMKEGLEGALSPSHVSEASLGTGTPAIPSPMNRLKEVVNGGPEL